MSNVSHNNGLQVHEVGIDMPKSPAERLAERKRLVALFAPTDDSALNAQREFWAKWRSNNFLFENDAASLIPSINPILTYGYLPEDARVVPIKLHLDATGGCIQFLANRTGMQVLAEAYASMIRAYGRTLSPLEDTHVRLRADVEDGVNTFILDWQFHSPKNAARSQQRFNILLAQGCMYAYRQWHRAKNDKIAEDFGCVSMLPFSNHSVLNRPHNGAMA